MSDNIPFEIQEEIIKRILPVKSLIRFRSVSKQWKSLIDSSRFIFDHSVNQNHYEYVSFVDDDTFPRHKFSHTLKQSSCSEIVNSSHGLVCLNVTTRNRKNTMSEIIVWNPSIRKSVRLQVRHVVSKKFVFGVCPKTGDPKIVMITPATPSMDWKAEVYRLSSMSWISVPINLGCRSIQFSPDASLHFDVWKMLKNDDSKFSFTKLFTVNDDLIGFGKNGQPIITCLDPELEFEELQFYKPSSERNIGLGIYGSEFHMFSYTESLVLINHPHSINE